jgi:outer membrane immunogenic protein
MFKSRLLAAASAFALCASGALAADLPSRTKAPGLAPMFTWTGFYVGAHVGYGFARTDIGLGPLASLDGLGSNGWTIGGKLGYDWQFAQRWVAGLVAEGNLSDINSELNVLGFSAEAKLQHSYAVRARLGYLVTPSTMLYGTAGWSWTKGKVSVPGFIGVSEDFNGLVVGAGIETNISGNWFLSAEYLYNFYGKANFGPLSIRPNVGEARLGLTYKFGGIGQAGAYPVFATAPTSWTGFHIGVQAGYEFANTELSAAPLLTFRGVGSQGLTGGLIAGYDWQFGPRWVAGLEADASLSAVKSSLDVLGVNVLDAKSEWSAAVRARLGYLFTPNTMTYVGAGYSWSSFKVSTPLAILNNSETFSGLQLAAGIETKLAQNWSARAEYVHTFYDKETYLGPVRWQPESGKFRVGASYRFGGGPVPVTARY